MQVLSSAVEAFLLVYCHFSVLSARFLPCSVVPWWHMEKMGLPDMVRRVRGLASDVRDNFARDAAPVLERRGKHAELREALIPAEAREALVKAGRELPQGVWHSAVTLAGSSEKKTRHPHLFAVLPLGSAVEAYFVDPEHEVGRRNLLRPKVANIVALSLYEGRPDEIAILRYRTVRGNDAMQTMHPNIVGGVDNLRGQLKIARDLIERDGIPQELIGIEEEITFRLVVRDDRALLQSRYASPQQMRAALEGEFSGTLEVKRVAQQRILERMARLVASGAMRPDSTENPV